MFADDTTLFITDENMLFAYDCLEIDLNNLDDWFRANSLTLNLTKTRVMSFSHNSVKCDPIHIGSMTLPETTEFKFLGTWFDSKLTWTCHMNCLLLKLNKNLHMLKMGKKFMSRHALLSLYYAHIYSHINYGILLWGNMASKGQLNKLQKVQNKCVSCILNKKATDLDFKQLRLLRIKDVVWLNNVKMGYKLRNNQLPVCVSILCSSDSHNKSLEKRHNYQTRCKDDHYHPLAKTKKYENSFLVKAVTDFNQLPDTLKKIASYEHFVKSIKNYHFLS